MKEFEAISDADSISAASTQDQGARNVLLSFVGALVDRLADNALGELLLIGFLIPGEGETGSTGLVEDSGDIRQANETMFVV